NMTFLWPSDILKDVPPITTGSFSTPIPRRPDYSLPQTFQPNQGLSRTLQRESLRRRLFKRPQRLLQSRRSLHQCRCLHKAGDRQILLCETKVACDLVFPEEKLLNDVKITKERPICAS